MVARVFRPVRCNGALAGDRLFLQTIFRMVLEHSRQARRALDQKRGQTLIPSW